MSFLDDPYVRAEIQRLAREAMQCPPVHVERAIEGPDLPRYQTDGAAGFDLAMWGWYVDGEDTPHNREFHLPPGYSIKVRTGIKVAIPRGFLGQLSGRSGLGINKGLESRIGIIDADYRGEIFTRLYNLGQEDVCVNLGDRVCQLVIQPVAQPAIILYDGDLADGFPTSRGTGGLGSTGTA